MEEWYRQQDYFKEENLVKIRTWIENEVINLSSFKSLDLAS